MNAKNTHIDKDPTMFNPVNGYVLRGLRTGDYCA